MRLRVWYVWNPPRKPLHYQVNSVEEAIKFIQERIKRDLEDSCITDNAMGLEVFEDGEWVEYYDDIGQDIDEIIEEREEENGQ